MDQANDGLPFGRRARARAALGSYLDAANQLGRARLAARIEDLVAELLGYAGAWVRARFQEVVAAEVRLRQARAHLAAEERLLAGLAIYRSEINLAEPALIDRCFERHAGDLEVSLQRAVNVGDGLLCWGALTAEALAAALAAVAARDFEPLLGMTVEDVLAEQWDDRSAAQWISRLTDLAAGAWNLDRALLSGGGAEQAAFLTIGVPDADQSIFANCGHTLVTTHDPERIVALRTIYGASMDTLKAAAGWKRSYELALTRIPVHVLPEFKPVRAKCT